MLNRNIYVLGSINIDLVIYTHRIPNKGETISGRDFITTAGGKGANQAVAASKLGSKVKMIGSVGNDYFKKQVIDSLKEAKVDITNVKEVNNKYTGVAIITRTKDDNRIILDAGANFELNEKDLIKGLDGKENDIFITQYEVPLEVVIDGLQLAKSKGMVTILNPAPVREVPNEIYQHVDYLVINQSESELITGVYPSDLEDCKRVYDLLKIKGLKNLVVTLGELGSVIINEEEHFRKAHKIKPVDTTGAGDAFIGAFAYGITMNYSDTEKLEFSNATSALVCLKEGAQQAMPTKKQVEEFRKGVIK